MASPAQFARNIRRLAGRIEENVNDVVIDVATAASQAVVLATPVDTGRARGNWQLGVGSPITSEISRDDPSGGATISANASAARTRRLGQTIFISNNVEYIGFLNDGSSAQAPAGFVQQAARAGSAVVAGARVVR